MYHRPRNRFKRMLFSAIFASISAPAFASEATDAGQEIAKTNCARCHAITDTGPSPLAKAPPFRTFKSNWPLENLEEALAEGIVTGHTMPMFEFDPDKISDLLAFIDTLKTSKN